MSLQQRNKPKEPPKQPEKAPFFLPTLPGVDQRFAPEQKAAAEQKQKDTHRLKRAAGSAESVFFTKLSEAHESASSDCTSLPSVPKPETITLTPRPDTDEEFFTYAKALSPAAMDLELRSLVTLDALQMFLGALTRRLRSHRDFEAVQTFMNVFLRMHGDVLAANAELQRDLEILAGAQRKEGERLLELLASSLGTLGFVRDTM